MHLTGLDWTGRRAQVIGRVLRLRQVARQQHRHGRADLSQIGTLPTEGAST
jgi:hypothetical protein